MNNQEVQKIFDLINDKSKILALTNGTNLDFLLDKAKNLHIVEYDKNRTDKITKRLKEKKVLFHVDCVEPSYPQANSFTPAKPKQFDNYINHIRSLKSTHSFDSVFINGRDRLRAAKASLDLLKDGGYIFIHDFWERPRYHDMLHWPELELCDQIPNKREVRVNNLKLAVFKKVTPKDVSDNNVFLYWHGKDFRLISMLRDLIYKHSNNSKNYRVHLLNQTNAIDYVNIPNNFYKLSLNHQSDYIRAAVIYKYGGVYLKSDTIVMNDLSSLFNNIEEYDGFFIKENNQNISPGVFGSKSNTLFMKRWLNDITNKINKTHKHRWTAFTTDLFKDYEDNNLLNNYKIYDGLDTMYPVNWDKCLTEFIRKPYDNYKTLIRTYQPVIIIVNSVYKYMEKFRVEEIPYMDMALSYFLNKSKENLK